MTRFIVTALGALRGNLVVDVLALIMGVALLPLAVLIDSARAIMTTIRQRRVLAERVMLCPDGHPVELWGAWTCGRCKSTFEAHGFASCPRCGERGDITCACQRTILNPLVRRSR